MAAFFIADSGVIKLTRSAYSKIQTTNCKQINKQLFLKPHNAALCYFAVLEGLFLLIKLHEKFLELSAKLLFKDIGGCK